MMEFNSKEHEQYYKEILEEASVKDVFMKRLVFNLGADESTRLPVGTIQHLSQIMESVHHFPEKEAVESEYFTQNDWNEILLLLGNRGEKGSIILRVVEKIVRTAYEVELAGNKIV